MYKPIKSSVFIKPFFEAKEKYEKTGIELPEYATNVLPDRGEIVAVGPEVTSVLVGQNVVFDRFKIDNAKDKTGLIDDTYLIVPEALILAILE